VGRSVIGVCAIVGTIVGGFLPALWGGSELGLSSLLLSGVGGVAGVFLGSRLSGI
jgi:hypothetical protein